MSQIALVKVTASQGRLAQVPSFKVTVAELVTLQLLGKGHVAKVARLKLSTSQLVAAEVQAAKVDTRKDWRFHF